MEKLWQIFLGWEQKTYSYLIDDCSEYKKAKIPKKGVIKRELIFYKNFVEGAQPDNKIKYL